MQYYDSSAERPSHVLASVMVEQWQWEARCDLRGYEKDTDQVPLHGTVDEKNQINKTWFTKYYGKYYGNIKSEGCYLEKTMAPNKLLIYQIPKSN